MSSFGDFIFAKVAYHAEDFNERFHSFFILTPFFMFKKTAQTAELSAALILFWRFSLKKEKAREKNFPHNSFEKAVENSVESVENKIKDKSDNIF